MSSWRQSFRIAADHPALPGHFPGRPIVPGVVVLDQVRLALCTRYPEARFSALPQVKFVTPLLPDQDADIEFREITADLFDFQVRAGTEIIASGRVRR